METNIQHKEQLQYAEVYISDMLALRNMFLQIHNTSKISSDFGIPFLLAKKENQIVSFATLILNRNGKISFKIWAKNTVSDQEKKNFYSKAENEFNRKKDLNFRDPEQLKSSIASMISWLNF